MNLKIKYFLACASRLTDKKRFNCPSCGSEKSLFVARKYVVTTLRRCARCELLFRAPTTTGEENAVFYQETYRQGFTSDTPTDHELSNLLKSGFSDSERSYATYIKILSALGGKPGDKVFDFGCSWGYGSWQLAKHGYSVTAFEISQPRCRYAREKLGISAYDKIDDIKDGGFDIFFSAHVLEHVPSVSAVFSYAKTKLKVGGLFVAFTPNGSEVYRRENGASWNKLWNMVHPNFLDDKFYAKAFPGVLLASNPYDLKKIEEVWATRGRGNAGILNGYELMAAVRNE